MDEQLKFDRKATSAFQDAMVNEKKSAFRLYQEFIIGNYNILNLFKYEIITAFLGRFPGALGLFLRSKFYRYLFKKKIGHNIYFGENIVVRHPDKIEIGNNVIIDDLCILDARGTNNKGIKLADNVMIGRNTFLFGNGYLEIGFNSKINVNCIVQSETNVKIGKNVFIGAFCHIIGLGKHNYERTDIPIRAQGMKLSEGIQIEDDIIIGADVKILDGVKIGTGSLIGAGAVVTKDIPSFSIATGIPAKVIKRRE